MFQMFGRPKRPPSPALSQFAAQFATLYLIYRALSGSPSLSPANLPALPVIARDEPVRAWKVAGITAAGGRFGTELRFTSVGVQSRYGAQLADAVCKSHKFRACLDPPNPECDCGWWAMPPGTDSDNLPGDRHSFLLDVELFGRIIEHEHEALCLDNAHCDERGDCDLADDDDHECVPCDCRGPLGGWRAQKQRVLSVTAPSWCYHGKSGAWCGAPARWFNLPAEQHGACTMSCDEHVGPRVVPVEWVRGRLGAELRGEFLAAGMPPAEIAVRDRIGAVHQYVGNGLPARMPSYVAELLQPASGMTYEHLVPLFASQGLRLSFRNLGDGIELRLIDDGNRMELWRETIRADMPGPWDKK